MYVGITRAQRTLHLSYAEKRSLAREAIACTPSRFIDEMGHDAIARPTGAPADKATGCRSKGHAYNQTCRQ